MWHFLSRSQFSQLGSMGVTNSLTLGDRTYPRLQPKFRDTIPIKVKIYKVFAPMSIPINPR
jgi:hypothetical protein